MVQPRVELGAPERSTAAGNLSGDGHAVDIAYEPPAVDCLSGGLVVVYACGPVRDQNAFSEQVLSIA